MQQINKLVALALVVGVVAGCSSLNTLPANPPPPTYCKTSSCPVSVTVNVTSSPFKCTINVDPELLDVSQGPGTKTITWTLTGAEWSKDGINLPIKFGPNASGVMSLPVVSGPSVSVTYTRPAKGGNVYGYGVFTFAVLSQICKIDPWVQD
jgi:hypothetical protein